MEHFLSVIQHNDAFIQRWGYGVLFGAAWIEGFHSMIIGGFIASLGKLNVWIVVLVMSIGHVMAGFSWYTLGFVLGAKPLARWGKYLRLNEEKLSQAGQYFEKHGGKAIFFTQVTVGLTIAVCILAGVLKIRVKKFALYNALGSLTWTAITVLFGYTFGLSFKLFSHYMQSFTRVIIFFFVFLAGAVIVWHILQKVFQSRFLKSVLGGFAALLRSKNGDAKE